MKFAPFTGIDNHKKSIIFGCVLLEPEDDESFIWAFQQFLKAMGGKEPNYIICDQDAGIINAVPAVFKKARHRFRMWHIMKKVTDKVGSIICKETDCLSRLNNVVWSENLEPEEFEENWAKVISEFSLEGNKWLTGNVYGYTPPDPVTNFEVSIVEDANKRKRYAVEYNRRTMDVRCAFKLFERKGILCNHIIWICSAKFKEIPEKYILRRWSKNALRNTVYDLNGNLLENYDLTGNSKF
ncbi:protein FAR1-RELATED SEQUENCE 3-like [Silene latifolia]|uniref:protein FAR1-RELATED SEQUENCE 3-like n=1 Tax=Silene latifolia TaxID=37657 RepID=UPI003D782A03